MARYQTHVEDGIVYVGTDDGLLEIGPVDVVVDVVGGPSWTISYTEEERARHPEMDTSDEGLTVDVVDMMQAMTHSERFVQTLAAHPTDTQGSGTDGVSPRLGLFAGKLLENLESGVA